jgi:hypothetical protein
MPKLNNTHETTEGFREFLTNNNKVCVVVNDFAGSTTNMTDLKKMLR